MTAPPSIVLESDQSGESVAGGGVRIAMRFWKLLVWLALAVVLLFGVSNLWLASGWGTGMAERKLKERTGQDWEVDSMSWSPWNGVTVDGVRMIQPEVLRKQLVEPVVEAGRIRVKLYWGQLLRGRIRASEVLVESPKVTMGIEMLAALAPRVAREQKTMKPVTPSVGPPQVDKPDKPAKKPDEKVPGSKPRSASKQEATETKRPPAGLPLRLRINDASVRVLAVSSGADLATFDGVTLDMPLFGEDARGVVSVGTLKVLGLSEVRGLEQEIVWKRPYLELEEKTVDIGGVKLRFLAWIGMGWSQLGRFPLLFDLAIDPQELDRARWFDRFALEVGAESVTGRLRVIGALLSPMTWRADMMFAGDGVTVREEHGSHDVAFDEVVVPAVFRQGQLRWDGMRMVGEDISVLGNGKASVRDGVLSVTRLVVSPEVSQMLMRGLNGAGIAGYSTGWWKDLETPDRKMRDLVVCGNLGELVVDAGHGYADRPVWDVVGSTLKFIRNEMREEGRDLAPIPNNEMLDNGNHEDYQR